MLANPAGCYARPQPVAWTAALDLLAQNALVSKPRESLPSRDSDRFGKIRAWQEEVKDTFCDLDIKPRDKTDFHASINNISRGELKVSFITADAQTVTRSTDLISGRPADCYFLNINVAGTSAVTDVRGRTQLDAGEAVLMDAMQPYQLDYPAPFRAICVQIPRCWLHQLGGGGIENAIGRGMHNASGAPRVLCAAVESLIDSRVAAHPEDVSIEMFLNVLRISLRSIEKSDLLTSSRSSSGPGIRLKILRQFLSDSFHDPDLRPSTAAQSLGWSLRTVHKTCQDAGTTFGKLLLDLRLSYVALQISSKRAGACRISDIAYEAGITDISYFCRAFKSKYKLTPSSYAREFG